MDTDLTPTDEREDEVFEEALAPFQPASMQVIEMLRQLSEQGKTVIVVTHDRSIAREADVRLEMEDGRIRSTGNYVAPSRSLTVAHKKKGKKK